jgi:biotin carboxylase
MITRGTGQKVVVIVNGVSSGIFLAPRFHARGISCVHLLSHAVFPEGIKSMKTADLNNTGSHYIESLVFEGDYDAIIRALDKYTVIGVIPGMELAVPLADALSERMGLPTNGTPGSEARRNKFLMQCAVRHAGVPTKRFVCTDSEQEVLAWKRAEAIPEIVIKPMNSAATDGVRFCTGDDEILEAFRALFGKENRIGEQNSRVLAEERLIGTEFGVNTVSWNGKHRLAEVWEYSKVRVEGAGNVYDSTRLRDWPDKKLMPVVKYAFRVLDALGIRYGAAHTEIILTKNGPLLVESGARVMGGKIPPDLIMQCAGQCQVDLMAFAYTDPEGFLAQVDAPYHLRNHIIRKHLIAGREGIPDGEMPVIDKLAGLKSCVRGDFIHLISDWYVHRTVDMLSSPATVFLLHENPAVIQQDYLAIRNYEIHHEKELFRVGTT